MKKSLEEEKKSEINKNYLIIGPRISFTEYKDLNEHFNIHGDGEKTLEIGEISIEEGSRVVIHAHGSNSGGNHQIELCSSLGYGSGIDYTYYNLQRLKKQCNVELFSCYGGNAIYNIGNLPENSTLMTFVDDEYSMWTDIAEELIKMSVIFPQPENPFTRFASFLATNADDTRFAINIEDNNKIFYSEFDKLNDFSNENIRAWQKIQISDFVKFINEAKNHSNDSNKEKIEQFIELVKDEDHLNQFINKFDVNLYRKMLVMNLITQGKIESIKSCLDHIEITNEDGIFLFIAARMGNKEALDLFLGSNLNFNIRLDIPILIAAEEGHIEIVKLLLEHNADIDCQDDQGRTPLLIAAEKGNIEMVEILLQRGANIDLQDKEGRTPLLIAAYEESIGMVELLSKHRVDIDHRDNKGYTPLSLAILKEDIKMVKLLLEHNADIDYQDDQDQTPLFIAIFKEDIEMVELLLEHNANINLQDKLGQTPLLIATQKGGERIVELLLENSAKNGSAREAAINQIDSKGKNLLDIAIENNQYSIAKLLIKAGIKHKEVDGYNLKFITILLRRAIIENDEEIIKSLSTHPSLKDATKEGGALVLYAREMKKPEVANYIIKHGFQQKTLAQGTKRKASIDPEEHSPRISPTDASKKIRNSIIFNNDQKPSNKKPRGGAKQTASSLVR